MNKYFVMEIEDKSTPHVCPVCGGTGIVPNGFYNRTSQSWLSITTVPETCRTCMGNGIVWNTIRFLSQDLY